MTEFDGRPELTAKTKRIVLARTLLIALLVGWMIIVTSFLVYNALVGARSRTVLLDCTQPVGKCFQNGQKRTGEVVKQIVQEELNTQKIVVIASSCADKSKTQTYKEIKTCVDERLGR